VLDKFAGRSHAFNNKMAKKSKLKPSVAICHLLLLKALEITYPRLKSLLISSIF
jgi:hypothetical protein